MLRFALVSILKRPVLKHVGKDPFTLGVETLEAFIESHGIQARIIRLNVPTPTVEAAADALGTTTDKIVKSLLFLVEGQPVLVITPGTNRVDYRKIARHYGVGRKRVKLADPATVFAMTGYEVGAVPPFGHLRSLDIILERSIFLQEIIFAGGGSEEALLEVRPEEILSVTAATTLDLHLET
jgi:Cys-tRNA(Pro) deacylase